MGDMWIVLLLVGFYNSLVEGVGHVPGGWHGRDVAPFQYDPGQECLAPGSKLLYCPNVESWEKTFCCGTTVKECCTSEEWVMTQVDGDQAEFEIKMEGTYMVAAGNITRWFKIVIIIICVCFVWFLLELTGGMTKRFFSLIRTFFKWVQKSNVVRKETVDYAKM